MAARKNKTPPSANVVPEYIQNSNLLNKRKITKRKLPSYTEAMLLLHTPEVLRLYFEATLEGLKAGDKDVIKMVGEMYDYVKRGGGITLNQQILNNNVAAGETAPVVGFDAFARRLAEARAGHALPAAAEMTTIEVHPADVATLPVEG
jgi:hypothetical protein